MVIQKLIEKRAELWENAKNFLNDHTDKDGKISAEDAATYDKMEKDLSDLSKNIERFQRQAAMDLLLAQPTTKPILNNPQDNTFLASKNNGDKRASNEYREAAITALRTKFKTVSNILQESVATDGGYLVPTEWDNQIITTLNEYNTMRTLAKVKPTSMTTEMPITTKSTIAYVVKENQNIPPSYMKFGTKTLKAYKIAAQTIVTNEMLADSGYDLETEIIENFANAIAGLEEDLFINGSGVDEPTGILTTAATDSDMTLTTAGTNLSSDDLISLVYDFNKNFRKDAVFLLNDATLAVIRKLKDNNQAYIWQPNYQAGEPDRLLGYPVYSSPYMPTIAAGNMVIAFGDFSKYVIGDRGARTFQQLNELYAANYSTGYIMTERVDGILTVNEALKVLQVKS